MAQVVFFKPLGITEHPDGKNEIDAVLSLILSVFRFVPIEFHVAAIVTTDSLVHTTVKVKPIHKKICGNTKKSNKKGV